jgi:hypothetical protein
MPIPPGSGLRGVGVRGVAARGYGQTLAALTASAESSSYAAATLSALSANITGASHSSSVATGTLSFTLIGSSTSTSGASGTLIGNGYLTGSSLGSTLGTAQLSASGALVGADVTLSYGIGVLSTSTSLIATSASLSYASGTLTHFAALTGSTASTGYAQGTISTVPALVGSASVTSNAMGELSSYSAQAPPGTYYCIFETPQVRDRPPYLPDSSRVQVMLWRHFENRLRGVNVWQRSDGTFCVDTPANYEAAQTNPAAYFSDDPIGPDLTSTEQGLSDSNVNYPWNPYPGSTNSEIPGSYAYNTNWDQTTQDFVLDPFLVNFWQGGAENVITQETALVLTAAGFGDCIREAPAGTLYTENDYNGGYNQ